MHGQLAWALLGGFPLVQAGVLRRHGYQRLERRQELPVEVVPQFTETVKVAGGGAGAAIELPDRLGPIHVSTTTVFLGSLPSGIPIPGVAFDANVAAPNPLVPNAEAPVIISGATSNHGIVIISPPKSGQEPSTTLQLSTTNVVFTNDLPPLDTSAPLVNTSGLGLMPAIRPETLTSEVSGTCEWLPPLNTGLTSLPLDTSLPSFPSVPLECALPVFSSSPLSSLTPVGAVLGLETTAPAAGELSRENSSTREPCETRTIASDITKTNPALGPAPEASNSLPSLNVPASETTASSSVELDLIINTSAAGPAGPETTEPTEVQNPAAGSQGFTLDQTLSLVSVLNLGNLGR